MFVFCRPFSSGSTMIFLLSAIVKRAISSSIIFFCSFEMLYLLLNSPLRGVGITSSSS